MFYINFPFRTEESIIFFSMVKMTYSLPANTIKNEQSNHFLPSTHKVKLNAHAFSLKPHALVKSSNEGDRTVLDKLRFKISISNNLLLFQKIIPNTHSNTFNKQYL